MIIVMIMRIIVVTSVIVIFLRKNIGLWTSTFRVGSLRSFSTFETDEEDRAEGTLSNSHAAELAFELNYYYPPS